jgi:DNA-binding transcriptional ArsR family regulator
LNPIRNIDDPRYVKALSHPLRVRILALLQEKDASPVELARLLHAKLGVVSYHVAALRDLGLLELVGTRQRRGAIEHHYRAAVQPQISNEAWGEAPVVAKQAYVSSFLSTLGAYIEASAAAGGFDRADAHFTRTVKQVDAKGWEALSAAFMRFLAEADGIIDQAGVRIARDGKGEDVLDVGLVLMLFEAAKLTTQRAPAKPAPKRRRPRSAT